MLHFLIFLGPPESKKGQARMFLLEECAMASTSAVADSLCVLFCSQQGLRGKGQSRVLFTST